MNEKLSETFVGIDVSKHALDIHIDPAGEFLHVSYDDEGIANACRRLLLLAPTLIVMEATGGLEVRLATELASKGLAVAVVNPRRVRDFAKASGELAKTDRIDAGVLSRFAKAIRPTARALKDADTRDLDDLVTRRRQLIEIRVQEAIRLGTATSKSSVKSIKTHIAWLDKQIDRIEDDMNDRLRNSDVWRVKDDLLRGIPASAPSLPRPCWPNARNSVTSTGGRSPNLLVWRPWPAIAEDTRASALSGAGAPMSEPCSIRASALG